MDETTLQMLRELTEAPGVPGQEDAVRRVVRTYMEPLGELVRDNLGGIACRRVGQAERPKIMLAGHMDEIGFMVTRITDEGFLRFQTLGGWWEHVMLAQRVEVYTRNGPIIGVIGSKPPHILEPEERKRIVEKKAMFIDIGAASRAEAEEWGITPGDPVVPICPFTMMHNAKLVMAKAWDNRFGCALAIEVVRQLQQQAHPNTVYGVGTVQEEVGIRGAATITSVVEPDIAFVLDVGVAGDMPGVDADSVNTALGKGPLILLYDSSMVPHTGLRNLVIDTARAEEIPLQIDRLAMGGTDGGRIHIFGAGIPTLVVGVPTRYIHTHAGIMHLEDFTNAVRLLVAVIKRLDAEMVQKLRGG